MIAYSYYGAKHEHLSDILPLLPMTETYVEPFAGSWAILLNRPAAPIEVANDLNEDLAHFWLTLQGDRAEELIGRLELTPYSKSIFAKACHPLTSDMDAVDRAFLWYVRICQSRNSLPMARPSNWAFTTQISRREMASTTSKWLNRVPHLLEVRERIFRVQIECDSALRVISKYDGENCLFYVDPPYVSDTRKHKNVYRFEMNDADHRALSDALHSCKGKVALSGYDGSLYDKLYGDFYKTVFEEKFVGSAGRKRKASEVLWTNYDITKLEEERTGVKQLAMFAAD